MSHGNILAALFFGSGFKSSHKPQVVNLVAEGGAERGLNRLTATRYLFYACYEAF